MILSSINLNFTEPLIFFVEFGHVHLNIIRQQYLRRRIGLTGREEKVLIDRISEAKEQKILIPKELTTRSCVRGVYGFFAVKMNEEIPFYIGKSNNIFLRMFGRSSHLNSYIRGLRNTPVLQNIEKYLETDYHIEIKILKKVKYKGDNFESDANRLALAELKELVEYQDKGFCLVQLSEAVKEKYERIEWETKFPKKL